MLERYAAWLKELDERLAQRQADSGPLLSLRHLNEELHRWWQAGSAVTQWEWQLFIETLRQQSHPDAAKAPTTPPLWSETLWQQLSAITDHTQVEWAELLQDWQHQSQFQRGEWVAMGIYQCQQCQHQWQLTHPQPLCDCPTCGCGDFIRHGLPV